MQLIVVRPRRAWLMVRVAAWAVVLSSTVRFCSLPTALNLLTVKRAGQYGASLDQPEIVSAVDAVLGMNVLVFEPICWKRATLLHRFLGLRGFDTTIVFGLRKDPAGELAGHAWLENAGKPILESDEPNYTVTYRFPSAEHCNVELARLRRS
ncbi:MAG TPA: lasso peptide biosynthesis B2 protein [Pyrinomonadaceae bacterium]|nr:lasso peptide biosynthesis B2 protein [Pyrinomonadaceae bacterium]